MTIGEAIDALESAEFSSYEFRMNKDSIEYAMRLLTRKYIAALAIEGNDPIEVGKTLTEMVEQEAAYRFTGR